MQRILTLRDAKEVNASRFLGEVMELNDGTRSKTARNLMIDSRTASKYLEGK